MEGSIADVTWRGRLASHLGNWTFEQVRVPGIALLNCTKKSLALCCACRLLLSFFPEQAPCGNIFTQLVLLLEILKKNKEVPYWLKFYLKWEMHLLKEAGYGLDTSKCVVTGTRENLTHISPRSGAIVCEAVGQQYLRKLLPIPAFLRGEEEAAISEEDYRNGGNLTGYFLQKHLPSERTDLLALRQMLLSALELV